MPAAPSPIHLIGGTDEFTVKERAAQLAAQLAPKSAGEFGIEVIEGDTVEEVLSYVQYDIADMKRAMRLDIEAACKQGRLTFAEGKSLLQYYDNGLEGYTYLEE